MEALSKDRAAAPATPTVPFNRGGLQLGERPKYTPGTYFVQTWGCQMNEEDSEQMTLYLEDLGLRPVDSFLKAQVVILNTCSVRKKPEDKAFSMMGELRQLKESRPDMVIGVAGCMAQARADEIHQRAPHIDFVLNGLNLIQKLAYFNIFVRVIFSISNNSKSILNIGKLVRI